MTHHDDEHTLLLCSAAAGCCNQLQWLRVAESMVERRWTIHLSIAAVTVKLTHVNWKVLALPSWARALLRCFSYSFTDTCRNKTGMHAGQQLRRLPQHKVVGKESLLAMMRRNGVRRTPDSLREIWHAVVLVCAGSISHTHAV